MKLGLIFTNDWELFGDGSGDYYEVQHKPLEELLQVFKSYNAKLTIMAEVGQQLTFKKYSVDDQYFEKISSDWEMILKKSISMGNDVQFHFHPQWTKSSFDKNQNKWILDTSKWRLSDLTENEMYQNIKIGKEYLESLLNEVKSDYKCRIFRAGGFCIQPSTIPLKVLKENGIIADTSVIKGEFNSNLYDFRNAFSNLIPYYTSKEIEYLGKEEDGILEFPVYTFNSFNSKILKKYFPILNYLLFDGIKISNSFIDWNRNKDKIKNERYPSKNRYYKQHQNKNLKFYLNSILSKNYFHLDYDFLPPEIFIDKLKKIINQYKNTKYKDSVLPVLSIGHVKDIHNTDNINRILELITLEFKSDIEFWTMSDALEYWKNKANKEE